MRLSEAIRLGAMLKPQGFGSMHPREAVESQRYCLGIRVIEKSCALGAAQDAGYRGDWLTKTLAPCPGCSDGAHWWITTAVMHLNDMHHWTRERIADWVETIENQQQPAAEQQVTALAVGE